MSKKKKRKSKQMQQTGWVDASFKVTSCSHTGVVPVKIGGFDVHLGGCSYIEPSVIDSVDLVCGLNGQTPYKTFFGQRLNFVDCELQDRGGVPSRWSEFIKEISEELVKGTKILAYCAAGHGRTGTFAASLIAVMEPDVEDPIEAIRDRHCKKAVESLEQATAIFALKGLQLPEKYTKEFATHSYNTKYSGPIPGADGKGPNGKYYHHILCKCGKCSASVYWNEGPCECGNKDCQWSGKSLGGSVKSITLHTHHYECKCGKCNNTTYYLETLCECADCVEEREIAQHEWWCSCDECIAIKCDDDCVGPTNPNCHCYDCLPERIKEQIEHVDFVNRQYGSGNHPLECKCAQCIEEMDEFYNKQQSFLNEGHDTNCLCQFCWDKAEAAQLVG